MRLKLGRPDIDDYRSLFDLADADNDTALSVTWLGVSTLLVDDGTSAALTDGFFSRPALLDVALRRLTAVLPVHTHFDHAMDSARVAERTGARLIGGESTANIARGHGLSPDQIVIATSGEEIALGPFGVTLIESHHCPPDRFPGEITAPVVPPAKASAFRCGETWSTLIHHAPSDRRLLIQGSAGFLPGALAGRRAEVACLGIGQLGVQPQDYIEQYWEQTVLAVEARQVVLIHWDDFFRPLTAPMIALPYAGDDLDASMRVLSRLAQRDGVGLHLPTVWQRADPWT